MKKNLLLLFSLMSICLLINHNLSFAIDIKKDKGVIGTETAGVSGVSDGGSKYFYSCKFEKCNEIKNNISKINLETDKDMDELTNLINSNTDKKLVELKNDVDKLRER